MEAAVAQAAASAGAADEASRLFSKPDVSHERRPDGSIVIRSRRELGSVPRCVGVWLERWAAAEPNRVFLAERDAAGGWRRITYEETARAANAVAQSLLDRGLGPERPLLILADNGIDHGLMALGAMHVGVPVVPVSTPYARREPGFRQAALHLRPGQAGPDLCRRGGSLRQGAGSHRRGAARRGGREPRQPRRHAGHAVLDADGGAADAGGRCRFRPGRARYAGQDPVHLRLDRPAQGRDQHPAHDVRQPGERSRGLDRSSTTIRR